MYRSATRPMVTDQGSNIISVLNITHEARFPCMADRCNTRIETTWCREEKKNTFFSVLNASVRQLRKFVNQTSGIQIKLPKTFKGSCGTCYCP